MPLSATYWAISSKLASRPLIVTEDVCTIEAGENGAAAFVMGEAGGRVPSGDPFNCAISLAAASALLSRPVGTSSHSTRSRVESARSTSIGSVIPGIGHRFAAARRVFSTATLG
jgi:hypothetical protein